MNTWIWDVVINHSDNDTRQNMLKNLPFNNDTLDAILSRAKDICPEMRKITYEKLIKNKVSLDEVPSSDRKYILQLLLKENIEENKSSAKNCIKSLLFNEMVI